MSGVGRKKGFKCSEETKKKMSLARLGKKFPPYKVKNEHGGTGLHVGYNGYCTTTIDKKQVPVHRLIAEKAIGRKLKFSEKVHHINMNKLDNRNCNLLVCSHHYHTQIHKKMAEAWVKQVGL